jgi:hypothetical protein
LKDAEGSAMALRRGGMSDRSAVVECTIYFRNSRRLERLGTVSENNRVPKTGYRRRDLHGRLFPMFCDNMMKMVNIDKKAS